jgi:hypothetical protein
MHFANVDEVIRKKLSIYLATELKAGVSIGNLDLSENTVTLSNIHIHDLKNTYDLRIQKIYIQYNLIKYLISNFKITKTISQISVYDPVIQYTYAPKRLKNKVNKPLDINQYFKRLNVYNGKIFINASDSVSSIEPGTWRIRETFHGTQVTINNTRKTNIFIKAFSSNNAEFISKMELLKGKLQYADLSLENYQPQSIEMKAIENLKVDMGLRFSMQIPEPANKKKKPLPSIYLAAGIHQMSAKVQGHQIDVFNMRVNGRRNSLEVHSTKAYVDRSKVLIEGIINNPLSPNPTLVSNLNLEKLHLSDFIPTISGDLTGDVKISGVLSKPDIIMNGHSNSIVYQKQTFTSVDLSGNYVNRVLDFKIKDANWGGNQITGSGQYTAGDTLSIDLELANQFDPPSIPMINGKIHSKMSFKGGKATVLLSFDDVTIKQGKYQFEHLNGKGTMLNRDVSFKLETADQELKAEGNINLDSYAYKGKVIISRYPIKQYLPDKLIRDLSPILEGTVNAVGNRKNIITNMLLHVTEDTKHLYEIQLNSSLQADMKGKSVQLDIHNLQGQYNNVPIQLSFSAKGDFDSLYTSDLKLNDNIAAEGWLNWKSKMKYGFSIQGIDLDINNYLTYISPFGKKSPYSGGCNLNLEYNVVDDNKIAGTLNLKDVDLNLGLYPLKSSLTLSGTTDDIRIDSLTIGNTQSEILSGMGSLKDQHRLSLNVLLNQFQINNVKPNADFSGNINAKMVVNIDLQDKSNETTLQPLLVADLLGLKCEYGGLSADSLLIRFTQYRDYIQVDTLIAFSLHQANIEGQGSIGYNILNGKQYPSDRTIKLIAQTDIINLVELLTNHFISGHGKGTINLEVGIQDEGLSVKQGSILIPYGSFTAISQTEPINKVQINAQISDNKLDLKQCRFYWGKGYINVRNEIREDGKDFNIAMLDLGQFFIKSSQEGIPVTVPDYSQPNTTVNAVLKGQFSNEATITGPWDDMHIEAEADLTNGYGLYPPKTSNLLQLINTVRESYGSKEVTDPLPFTMDAIIRFKENMRYVTYPTNFLVTSDSYLRIIYDGNMFQVPEALFISEQGTLDMFGTTFAVDYLEVDVSHLSTKLKGTFYKKASDGSLITLNVSQLNDPHKDFIQNLKFSLQSDNPNDKSNTQILAKLRYNRPLEDLSRAQQQTILQDEAIQLIGVNLGSSFIDPYLSPFESRMRKILHVDFFNISPGFIENVVNEYVINNSANPDIPSQTLYPGNQNIINIGSTILLNNLSINVGKYVFRSVFIDYTALLQETTNFSKATRLAVYHNTSLRVSLPWYLRMTYTFQIRPGREANSHEIFIQRSFRF